MNRAQVTILVIIVGILVVGICVGFVLLSAPRFEVVEAVYYAPYEGSGTIGECSLTIKNGGGSAAYNVTLSIKDENGNPIELGKQEDQGTVGAGGSFSVRMSLSKSTATQGMEVAISYTYTDWAGKINSNTAKMVVKPKSII